VAVAVSSTSVSVNFPCPKRSFTGISGKKNRKSMTGRETRREKFKNLFKV
jgi:hypothetical protein